MPARIDSILIDSDHIATAIRNAGNLKPKLHFLMEIWHKVGVFYARRDQSIMHNFNNTGRQP